MEYVETEVGNLVAVVISDSINQEEFCDLIPEMKKKIEQSGRINFYLEICDEVKWEAESFWSDINFNLKHAQDIKKVAFIGNEQLEEKIIDLLKPLANAEIRWYPRPEKAEALKWVKF